MTVQHPPYKVGDRARWEWEDDSILEAEIVASLGGNPRDLWFLWAGQGVQLWSDDDQSLSYIFTQPGLRSAVLTRDTPPAKAAEPLVHYSEEMPS